MLICKGGGCTYDKDICCYECDNDQCDVRCDDDAKTCGNIEEVENAAATFEKNSCVIQSIVDVIENKKRLEEQEKNSRN